jgi:hypothetical protein
MIDTFLVFLFEFGGALLAVRKRAYPQVRQEPDSGFQRTIER